MNESIVDLNLNMWTVFFTLFNAVVLYLILRKLLFAPVKNFMDQRRDAIADEFKKAGSLKDEAGALKGLYEGKLANIEDEKKEILDEARKMGSYVYEKSKKEAEKEKERILKSAEIEKRHMYDKAKEDLKKETALMSIGIAEGILKKEIDSKTNEHILEMLLDDISKVKV
ncbi:MAG: F0F1 ATP synthase subunit B [Caulobacteraceae bacterium]